MHVVQNIDEVVLAKLLVSVLFHQFSGLAELLGPVDNFLQTSHRLSPVLEISTLFLANMVTHEVTDDFRSSMFIFFLANYSPVDVQSLEFRIA